VIEQNSTPKRKTAILPEDFANLLAALVLTGIEVAE
jgi:hypothetical protein